MLNPCQPLGCGKHISIYGQSCSHVYPPYSINRRASYLNQLCTINTHRNADLDLTAVALTKRRYSWLQELSGRGGTAPLPCRWIAGQSDRLTRHPSDTTLYELQARSYNQLQQPLQQHQAQAYSYAWQGNLFAAIQQLEMAKQAGGSFYELSTLESDLRELREMLEARAKK